MARLEPVALRFSKRTRLGRLYPAATWREESGQLVIPVTSPMDAPAELLALLDDVVDPLGDLPDAHAPGAASAEGTGAVAGIGDDGSVGSPAS